MSNFGVLEEQDFIDAHHTAKKFYDPSVHSDFDNIEEYERTILFERARELSKLREEMQ